MDAGSLKAFVDTSTRAMRAEPEIGKAPSPEPASGGAVNAVDLPGSPAGSRASWALYVPPWPELPGAVSRRSRDLHLALYESYLHQAKANGGLAPLERYRASDSDAVAAVIEHELFFQGLTLEPPVPAPAVTAALIGRFGSLDGWWREMTEAASCAHAWVMTAVCARDRDDVQVLMLDRHDGAPPGYVPFCAVDVADHAYVLDHGLLKSRYMEALFRFLNWEALEERFTAR